VGTFNEDQARDETGKWTSGGGRDTTTVLEPRTALAEYQNYAFKRVNDELRSGTVSPETQARVQAIDKLIDEQKARNVDLVRGDGAGLSSVLFEKAGIRNLSLTRDNFMTPESQARIEALNNKLVGMEFTDKAFVSTSASEKIALDKFVPGSSEIKEYGGSGLVHISGRVKALDVDKHTGMGAKEQERLLPRNTRLRVEGVDIQAHPDGQRIYLEWDVRVVK
jgi:hypothetical protein